MGSFLPVSFHGSLVPKLPKSKRPMRLFEVWRRPTKVTASTMFVELTLSIGMSGDGENAPSVGVGAVRIGIDIRACLANK
jgi:uncharacterized pyridoxal phosphate-containing UPF0001 family protein